LDDELGGSHNLEAAGSVEVSYQDVRQGHDGGSDEFGDGVSRHRGDYCSPDGFRNPSCLTIRYSDLAQNGALFVCRPLSRRSSADSIARGIAYAIKKPADVDVNEIVVRPTVQEF
jgi:hypothetical protein